MSVTDTLLAVSGLLGGNSGGGGGGEAVLVNKTVSANGTYLPSADSADGYKKVVVNVPTPTLTTKTITENGTYTASSDNADGYREIVVNVEDSMIEVTISDSGSVSQALDANKIYHFTGALTALTITLNTPSANKNAHYHFDFLSGATAPTVTIPNTVTMPDGWSVDAENRYEVDILNNYATAAIWAVNA